MRPTALLAAALALPGCSFALVRGPSSTVDLASPAATHCTESGFFPGLDALTGALALAGSVTGVIVEHTSTDGRPKDFGLYYGLPLVALGIVYLASATFGTNRIEDCVEVKSRTAPPVVTPVPTE
jgi:hypothetical protein